MIDGPDKVLQPDDLFLQGQAVSLQDERVLEALRGLPSAERGTKRNARDVLVAVDLHDGVGGRQANVYRLVLLEGRHAAVDYVIVHERPHRVMDENVGGAFRAGLEPLEGGRLTGGPAGDHRPDLGQTVLPHQRLGLLQVEAVDHHDHMVDGPVGLEGVEGVPDYGLAGELDELLGHLGPEALAHTAGQDDGGHDHDMRDNPVPDN